MRLWSCILSVGKCTMPSADSGIPSKRPPLRSRHLLFLVLVVIAFAFVSVPELFSPWVYFTGGSFHLMPWWSGAGSFTAPDGQYQLYLYVSPMNTGSTVTHTTALAGAGHLGTPSGERLVLEVQGDMDKHLPQDTIGRRVEISSYVRSKPRTFSAYTPVGSPQVKLTGIWSWKDRRTRNSRPSGRRPWARSAAEACTFRHYPAGVGQVVPACVPAALITL